MWPFLIGWRSKRQRLQLKRLYCSFCYSFPRMILKWSPLVGDIDKVIKVNGVLLDRLVLEEEYVAVLFLGECLEEEKVRKTLKSFDKNFSIRKLAMSLWRVWRRSTRSSTRSTSSLSRLTSHSMPRRIRSKLSQQLASLGKYFNIVHIYSHPSWKVFWNKERQLLKNFEPENVSEMAACWSMTESWTMLCHFWSGWPTWKISRLTEGLKRWGKEKWEKN